MNPLNQPNSSESPEVFIHELIEAYGSAELRRHTWNKLVKEQKISHTKIHIDPTTWISESREGNIYLGTQKMDDGLRNQLIFEGEKTDYDNEIIYRFAHEIAHTVAYELYDQYPEIYQLFQVISSNRSHGKGGFSSIGNLDFYERQGVGIQSTEDLTELVNMYLIDPNYLQRYLDFLTSEQYQNERENIGLTTIKKPIAQHIFKTIQQSITQWLDSKS